MPSLDGVKVFAESPVIPGSECESCGAECRLHRVLSVRMASHPSDAPRTVLEVDLEPEALFGWAECTACEWVGWPEVPVGHISLN